MGFLDNSRNVPHLIFHSSVANTDTATVNHCLWVLSIICEEAVIAWWALVFVQFLCNRSQVSNFCYTLHLENQQSCLLLRIWQGRKQPFNNLSLKPKHLLFQFEITNAYFWRYSEAMSCSAAVCIVVAPYQQPCTRWYRCNKKSIPQQPTNKSDSNKCTYTHSRINILCLLIF